jgi:hypothetical protein
VLLLDTGSTNEALKIQCYFTPHNYRFVDDRSEYTVRGLCSGVSNAQLLRLDNCQLFDSSAPAERRLLTADYLPFKPGLSLTYDQVVGSMDGSGAPRAVRRVFSFLEGGTISTSITHTYKLPASTRISASLNLKNWTSARATQKVYKEGPTLYYRLNGSVVELGQKTSGQQSQPSSVPEGALIIEYQPVLKLGAKAGESWKYSHGSDLHQYTLVKFDEHKGRSSAVIKEVVTNIAKPERYFEIQHVYVQEVGEVEQIESSRATSGLMRIYSVMRLVEENELSSEGPPKKGKGSNAAKEP